MNIQETLKEAKTPEEVEKIIEQSYPGWLILSLNGYSKDYPHLENNWKTICSKLNVQPQKIVLVRDIIFDKENSQLNNICEFITKHGYVVRRYTEFLACSVCEKAIPCKEIWHLLKEKNFPVPNNWSDKCSSCIGSK